MPRRARLARRAALRRARQRAPVRGQHDPWRDALIDLFEALSIDDRDAIAFAPEVDLAELPVWALWREDDNANSFEMERYRSYSKAELYERVFRERKHKQFYWVDPVE